MSGGGRKTEKGGAKDTLIWQMIRRLRKKCQQAINWDYQLFWFYRQCCSQQKFAHFLKHHFLYYNIYGLFLNHLCLYILRLCLYILQHIWFIFNLLFLIYILVRFFLSVSKIIYIMIKFHYSKIIFVPQFTITMYCYYYFLFCTL